MGTHMLFVNVHKAFDTVEHSYLWSCLVNQNIPTKIINIFKKNYIYIYIYRMGWKRMGGGERERE